jgi:hypothetical protein
MARKKSEPKEEAKAPKKAPSVTTFLSKISTPKARANGGNSPAKDLLGGVTKGDLAAVGRGDSPAAGDDNVVVEDLPGATFEIELNAQGTDGSGRARGRVTERVQWQGVVDVRGVFAGAMAGDGTTRAKDVSSGGVFVETARLLEVGDPVVLSFPGDDGKRVVVSGRVRWVTPFGRVDDPTPGMGIEFVGVDKHKRAKLDSLLSRARS